MRIAVIGGGAAGFFAAIAAKKANSKNQVVLFERSTKVLKKVKISGGGRCNVTHAEPDNRRLVENYPRGKNFLRKAFSHFSVKDTISWYQQAGVALKTEADGRMFPQSDNSQTIIDCLLSKTHQLSIEIVKETTIEKITPSLSVYVGGHPREFDRVIIATGGHKRPEGYQLIRELGHQIVQPVPSLFTFNLPNHTLLSLQGLTTFCQLQLVGTTLKTEGPLLVTHWGLSGPAVLKLSALAARHLAAADYSFKVTIKFLPQSKEDVLRSQLKEMRQSQKQIQNKPISDLPSRLWMFLLTQTGITPEKKFCEVSNKEINQLINVLLYYQVDVQGKTTFKEEFVTCGGVTLTEVDQSMQSKICPGLYFAGEVLDIDGVTGGFNFQAAWTTGFIAGNTAGGHQ